MGKKLNLNANIFSVLIHNADTLSLINELAAKIKNRNSVLNDALDIGVPILYARIFGKETKVPSEQSSPHSPKVGRELKELRKVIDDLFIEMAVQETLLAALFNAKVAELDGETVNAENLRDGSLCDLPELVAGLKADLTEPPKRGDGE